MLYTHNCIRSIRLSDFQDHTKQVYSIVLYLHLISTTEKVR